MGIANVNSSINGFCYSIWEIANNAIKYFQEIDYHG